MRQRASSSTSSSLSPSLYPPPLVSSNAPNARSDAFCASERPRMPVIEALVGTISSQRVQRLATVQILQDNYSIIAATGQHPAIRTHRLLAISPPEAV